MPYRKKNSKSVDSDTLHALVQKGATHPLIKARLDFAEPDQLLKNFIRKLMGVERVYPRMLPTQKSGRWSTTEPPRVNFPPDCISLDCGIQRDHVPEGDACFSARECIVPDEGTYWLCFDFDAIEAKIAAAYSGDLRDLEAFRQKWDVHTLTACVMFGLPLPKNPVNPHTSPEDAEWRAKLNWGGKEDRRRHLAKTFRYALQFGSSEYSALESRDIEKLGLTREETLLQARRYLASKPLLTKAKRLTWDQVAKTQEARTFLGRRRKLYMRGEDHIRWRVDGKPCEAQRQGWSHRVSGSVSDMMNDTLIQILAPGSPALRLGLNKHDGAEIVFPSTVAPSQALALCKPIVEREWVIEGHTIVSTAEWNIITSEGHKEKV